MITKLQKQARRDLATFMKFGAAMDLHNAAMIEYLKGIAKPLLGTLAAVGASAGAAYYFTKKDKERHQEELGNSFKSLAVRNPLFDRNPAQFLERFGELTVISPTIAKNPTLASKLLDKKIKTGFSVDDIHKLTSIEHNTSSARGFHPGAAARASAGHALETLVGAFGSDAISYTKDLNKDLEGAREMISRGKKLTGSSVDKAIADYEARRGGVLEKKSSAQRVSDECLGTMLAERFVLIKQSGVFSQGLKNMGTGLQYFAPAIALGGGLELLRQAVESRRNAQLEAAADKHFAQLMRSSDVVKGPENAELAREAFATLKAVAPSLASRPLVAKTFIEFTVGAGQLAPQTVQQLAEAEDKIRGAAGKGGFFEELKASIGGKGVGNIMKYTQNDINDMSPRFGRSKTKKQK